MNHIENQEYRCYHFGNFYLSSIQQGIQSAHGQMELFNKYVGSDKKDKPKEDMLWEWSKNHKTMICLNGGMNINIEDIFNLVAYSGNPYPWSSFIESKDALDGLLTNMAIILPDYIYGTAEEVRRNRATFNNEERGYFDSNGWRAGSLREFSDFERDLIELLNSCGLAK